MHGGVGEGIGGLKAEKAPSVGAGDGAVVVNSTGNGAARGDSVGATKNAGVGLAVQPPNPRAVIKNVMEPRALAAPRGLIFSAADRALVNCQPVR